MQFDEKSNEPMNLNQGEWYRPIGILVGRDEWKICSS